MEVRGTRTGFTLVEMLVVVAIMGLLATLVFGYVIPRLQEAKQKVAEVQVDDFERTLAMYYMRHQRYPATHEGLHALSEDGQMPMIPLDPWGNSYDYYYPGNGEPGTYDIICYGRDGRSGGDGFDADISNWTLRDKREDKSSGQVR